VAVGASCAVTAPRVLVSPSVLALPALSPGMPSGTVPDVVLLGANVESPESAWSEGAQAARMAIVAANGRYFVICQSPVEAGPITGSATACSHSCNPC
jgi:hypothetical protein